jgi:hypothetical protein
MKKKLALFFAQISVPLILISWWHTIVSNTTTQFVGGIIAIILSSALGLFSIIQYEKFKKNT